MNQIPKIDRRSFVVGAATAGGGLALGLDIPFGGPKSRRAQGATPEINAWVVIKPDDTVVIRMARSEMGQGTITGLAQLVAEELECDWSKVTYRVSDARREREAQARVGRLLHRRQPRHPHVARVRAQGRRRRAHDAGPGRRQRVEGAGLANARRPTA